MTPQQIVGLGVRLFAAWLGLINLGFLLSFWLTPANLRNLQAQPSVIAFTAAQVLLLFLAIVLWMFPMVAAHGIVPRTRFDNVIKLPALEAARVGCALLGLLLAGGAASVLIKLLLVTILRTGPASMLSGWTDDDKAVGLGAIVQLGLGLVFMFRSASFALLVLRPDTLPGGQKPE